MKTAIFTLFALTMVGMILTPVASQGDGSGPGFELDLNVILEKCTVGLEPLLEMIPENFTLDADLENTTDSLIGNTTWQEVCTVINTNVSEYLETFNITSQFQIPMSSPECPLSGFIPLLPALLQVRSVDEAFKVIRDLLLGVINEANHLLCTQQGDDVCANVIFNSTVEVDEGILNGTCYEDAQEQWGCCYFVLENTIGGIYELTLPLQKLLTNPLLQQFLAPEDVMVITELFDGLKNATEACCAEDNDDECESPDDLEDALGEAPDLEGRQCDGTSKDSGNEGGANEDQTTGSLGAGNTYTLGAGAVIVSILAVITQFV